MAHIVLFWGTGYMGNTFADHEWPDIVVHFNNSHAEYIFMLLLSSDFKINFFKAVCRYYPECQTVMIQIMPGILLVLISVKITCIFKLAAAIVVRNICQAILKSFTLCLYSCML